MSNFNIFHTIINSKKISGEENGEIEGRMSNPRKRDRLASSKKKKALKLIPNEYTRIENIKYENLDTRLKRETKQMGQDIIQMIIYEYVSDDTIFNILSRLRDRPYQLLKVYEEIGEKFINSKNERLKYFLNKAFSNLWFLSSKQSFPEEITCAYELDYFFKNTDPYCLDLYDCYNEIMRFLNIKEVLVIDFQKDNDYFMQKGCLGYYISYGLVDKRLGLLLNYYSHPQGKPFDSWNVFSNWAENWSGIHIKMRRIYYIVIMSIFNKINEVINKLKALFKEKLYNKYNVESILTEMIKNYNTKVIEFSNKDLDLYIRETDVVTEYYTIVENKSQYFNFFDEIDSYLIRVFDLIFEIPNENKENEINTIVNYVKDLNFLTDIVTRIEKEVNYPDNRYIKYKFQDNNSADHLRIDIKEFSWFYSTKEYGKTLYYTGDICAKLDDQLSEFWFEYLKERLYRLEEKEQIKQYGANFY